MQLAPPPVRRRPESLFQGIEQIAARALAKAQTVTFPTKRWRNDIYGFADYFFGITEFSDGQREIIDGFLKHRNISTRSGHKCGKTFVLALLALWAWCTFARANVVLFASTEYQVDNVDYGEIKRLYRSAEDRGRPLGGTLHESARKGLRAVDPGGNERKLWGVVARSIEAAAGVSGPAVVLLGDEVSGQNDGFLTAISTSMAGASEFGRRFWISNPTKTSGKFYDSQTDKTGLWHKIHLSSLDTPNARGTGNIPGLADPEWLSEMRIEWVEGSAMWKIRVEGEFAHGQDGKAIPVNLVTEGQQAWHDAPDQGQLQIGLDPAGDGVLGDEAALAIRRGMRVRDVTGERGKTETELAKWVVDTVHEERRPRDAKPRVAIDTGGGIGTRVAAKLQAHLDASPDDFDLIELRSEQIMWGSDDCHTVRAGLWYGTRQFLEAGGGIPENAKLSRELNVPSLILVKGKDGKQRYDVTPKKEIKKEIGRSPDRADAVNLATWGWQTDGGGDEAPRRKSSETGDTQLAYADLDDDDLSPYDRADVSPYGGTF